MLVSLLLGHVFVFKIYSGTLQARTIDKYTYNVVDKDTFNMLFIILNMISVESHSKAESRNKNFILKQLTSVNNNS